MQKSENSVSAGGRKKMEVSVKWFIILHISLLVNTFTGVASKMAGREKFLSLRFCIYFGFELAVTFLFALSWQQILKHMSLTFAFTNKPVSVIYSLVWSAVIFGEVVTPRMIIGSIVILIGIIVGVSGND